MRKKQFLTYLGSEFIQSQYTEWGDADNPSLICCVHGLTRNGRDFDVLARLFKW